MGSISSEVAKNTASIVPTVIEPVEKSVAAAPESLLLRPLREIVAKESSARPGGVIPAVVRAQMGNDAGIVGAALLDRAVRE